MTLRTTGMYQNVGRDSAREVVDRLRMVIGASIARQTPQQELTASISSEADPFANLRAMIALKHGEAA